MVGLFQNVGPQMDRTFYVYRMTNRSRVVLYTGVTNSLEVRFWFHANAGAKSFTKRYKIDRLVYYEEYDDPSDAIVHLHLHTEYSLLDGAVRMKELMKKAVEFGMPAVAVTDHGNLFGAIEFYQEATRAGIKPIIGCEAYVAPGSHKDRPGSRRDAAYHFTLLAQDETGKVK